MSVELSASGRFEASSNPRLRGLSSEAVLGLHSARLRQSQATRRPKVFRLASVGSAASPAGYSTQRYSRPERAGRLGGFGEHHPPCPCGFVTQEYRGFVWRVTARAGVQHSVGSQACRYNNAVEFAPAFGLRRTRVPRAAHRKR